MKTRKVKSAGRYGARYGSYVRGKTAVLEAKQRTKQVCIFCNKPKLERLSKGIWQCEHCGKKFASHTYHLNK